ncbi:MAG: hypothetical protein M3O88_03195 [Actinomycetota bacterium]|nr:hypothetical protein [Actinomycetota bacterium]
MVTFVVEAYLSGSHRLLWRAQEPDRSAAYWLALRTDADPRLEVRVVEMRGETPQRPPITPRSNTSARREGRKLWLVCGPDSVEQ